MVSVRADMGVLCLLDDLRSRALALPVPFLDAGAMIGLGSGLEVWYLPSRESVASASVDVGCRIAVVQSWEVFKESGRLYLESTVVLGGVEKKASVA